MAMTKKEFDNLPDYVKKLPFDESEFDSDYIDPIIKLQREYRRKGLTLKLLKLLWQLYQLYNLWKEVGMNLFKSKKFVAFIIGMLSLVLTPILGVDPDISAKIIEAITWLLGTYLIGQSAADAITKGKTSGVVPDEKE